MWAEVDPGLNFQIRAFIHSVRELCEIEVSKNVQFSFSQNIPPIVWLWVLSLYSWLPFTWNIQAYSYFQPRYSSLRWLWDVPGLAKIGYSPLGWAKNKSRAPWGTWSPTVTVILLDESTVLTFPWPPLQRRKRCSTPTLLSLTESQWGHLVQTPAPRVHGTSSAEKIIPSFAVICNSQLLDLIQGTRGNHGAAEAGGRWHGLDTPVWSSTDNKIECSSLEE